MLQPAAFGDILRHCEEELGTADFNAITPYNEESGNGVLRHLYIRQGFHSKEIMVCFVTAKDSNLIRKQLTDLGNTLIADTHEIKSVMLNVNPHKTNVILGKKQYALSEKIPLQTHCAEFPFH